MNYLSHIIDMTRIFFAVASKSIPVMLLMAQTSGYGATHSALFVLESGQEIEEKVLELDKSHVLVRVSEALSDVSYVYIKDTVSGAKLLLESVDAFANPYLELYRAAGQPFTASIEVTSKRLDVGSVVSSTDRARTALVVEAVEGVLGGSGYRLGEGKFGEGLQALVNDCGQIVAVTGVAAEKAERELFRTRVNRDPLTFSIGIESILSQLTDAGVELSIASGTCASKLEEIAIDRKKTDELIKRNREIEEQQEKDKKELERLNRTNERQKTEKVKLQQELEEQRLEKERIEKEAVERIEQEIKLTEERDRHKKALEIERQQTAEEREFWRRQGLLTAALVLLVFWLFYRRYYRSRKQADSLRETVSNVEQEYDKSKLSELAALEKVNELSKALPDILFRSLSEDIPSFNVSGALLAREKELIVGRSPVKAQLILDYRTVSREHAKLAVSGSALRISDLNSAHGTFVANRKLEESEVVELQLGDEVAFGKYSYVIEAAS